MAKGKRGRPKGSKNKSAKGPKASPKAATSFALPDAGDTAQIWLAAGLAALVGGRSGNEAAVCADDFVTQFQERSGEGIPEDLGEAPEEEEEEEETEEEEEETEEEEEETEEEESDDDDSSDDDDDSEEEESEDEEEEEDEDDEPKKKKRGRPPRAKK